jgi:glycosyltransferase involved in cell wall biosynthesis
MAEVRGRGDEELPGVSVIVATRDRKELLRKCLGAIAAQDYPGAVDVLVVHDQVEPDASVESDRPGRRVAVLRNDRSPGLAGARNTGILAAAHPLIAFCDDDDEWLPDKISGQVAELQRSGADVIVSGIIVRYADREVARVPRPQDMTLEVLARRRVMEAHPSSVVVRRAALLEGIGLVDEDIPGSYGEDFDWMLRAAQHGEIAVLQQPAVRVLWGGQSYYAQKWATIIASIDYAVAKHAVLRRSPRGLARLYGRKAFALAALRKRRKAVYWAVTSMRLSWRERRAYLAILVATGLVSADWLLRLAHSRGRGI